MSSKTDSSEWLEDQKQQVSENGGGVGWDGATLQEMIQESEDLFEETGHYHGREELSMKSEQRTAYEQMFSQLRGGLVNARETTVDVSASPIVEQEGECCFAVYTPEGDSITLSTGILAHVHTMSDAIKYMVKHGWEDNPGIEPGNIFCNTDSQIGDAHTCDVQTIVPVFWEGELVAWAAGVTHAIETGGGMEGSMPVNNAKRYSDGLYTTCRKIGEDFELHQDWETESKHGVRTHDFFKLDERTRVAGCMMIRDLVHEILEKEGADAWKQFTREAIEDGRRGTQQRVKSMLVPGTYRRSIVTGIHMDKEEMDHPDGTNRQIVHAPLETTVNEDGSLEFDLEGANRWGFHPFNGAPSPLQAGLWVGLTETLIPGEKINDGAFFATDFHFPEGTWTNPQNSEVAHSLSWYTTNPTWSGLYRQICQAYHARGIVEETTAGNPNTGNIMQGGGINQYGQNTAINSFEMAAQGFGARGFMDGLDYSAAIWNPEGDMGDAEIWEMTEPLMFLGRNVKPNTGGPGKYRGGSGFESLRLIWGAKRWNMTHVDMDAGKTTADRGVFGGYPGASLYALRGHDTDLKERFENQEPIPHADRDPESGEFEGSFEGDVRRGQDIVPMERYEDYDVYHNPIRGGPGYGDPIERDPDKVKEDVEEGYVLPRFAESTYGVVLKQESESGEEDQYSVDTDATEELRESMMAEREEKSQPVHEWMDEEQERIREQDAIDVVKKTYMSSMRMSSEFESHFKEFWDLPDDWEPELSEEAEKELEGRFIQPFKRIWDKENVTQYDME